jgi:glycine betaine/proline transport system ATP-binding protein
MIGTGNASEPIRPRQCVHSAQHTVPIEARGLWKIYGLRAQEALDAVKQRRLEKHQVLERFGCGVGVADVSFRISAGEVFCVMGLSGSGKSTLVRLINRLIEPTSGQVLIDGEDITQHTGKELRRLRAEKIGMVFQNFALLPHRTVSENVALPLDIKRLSHRERRETALRTLDLVGLRGWENRYAHELSGGMQQRVGIARAMAGDPEILLMDEPFSALDPLIRRQLQDEFVQLIRTTRKTTIFITHDLDEAMKIGHRIAVMKDGVLVQVGTPEEILLRPANTYVTEFVSGVSAAGVLRALSIMEPIDAYRKRTSLDPPRAPRVQDSAKLETVIDLALHTDGALLVEDSAHEIIGVVEQAALLRALRRRAN